MTAEAKGAKSEPTGARFGARLAKEDFKFSSAHFTLFGPEQAEGLHGHNYRVGVEFWGPELDKLGFLADFAAVKGTIRKLCAEWDEKILIPSDAPFLEINMEGRSLRVDYADRRYSVPVEETELLPVTNITVEALARLFWRRLAQGDCWTGSSIDRVQVSIAETSGQGASYCDELEVP